MKFCQMTVSQIEEWFRGKEVEEIEPLLPQLADDNRKGVRFLAKRLEREIGKRKIELNQWEELSSKERGLQGRGCKFVAGIDEAGRGPLAGPVVAAAVILPPKVALPGVNDSKQLSVKQREDLFHEITTTALAWAVGSASPQYIDAAGIVEATRKAMMESLGELALGPDFLLIDAIDLPGYRVPQESIIGGDGKCACIAAASIIAKVTRDRWMQELDEIYPGYGFARHKGYPTKEHLEALVKLGPSPVHRLSFKPLSELQGRHLYRCRAQKDDKCTSAQPFGSL